MQNYFNYPLFSATEIFENRLVIDLARDLMSLEVEILDGDQTYIERFFTAIQSSTLSSTVAKNVSNYAFHIMGQDRGQKRGRSIRTFDLIESYRAVFDTTRVFTGEVLDIGCGNGLISSSLLDDNAKLYLSDVVDYRDASLHSLPFCKSVEGTALPFEKNHFNNVVLNTVLHHAYEPNDLLKEAIRVCSDKIYIFESLIGVTPETKVLKKHQESNQLSQKHWEVLKNCENRFVNLNIESQIQHAQFQDWLYNSVIQGDIPVPYNFQTDSGWQKLFKTVGLNLVKKEYLGYDQRTAPEYHVLYVCEVIK